MQSIFTSLTRHRLTISLFLLSFVAQGAFADHIHHITHNTSGWFDQDLTALTGATLPNPATGVTAFATTSDNHLHAFYATTDQHVHQLSFNNTSWTDQDLTALANGPIALGLGGIASFATGSQLHVFYIGNDLHIHQLFSNGANWGDQDLTVLAGGPVTDFDSLVAFQTIPNHQFHVYYLANNSNDLHELNFKSNTWSDQDLRTVANAPPSDRGWMAGFATGNQEHLFFTGFSPRDKRHMEHLFFNGTKWANQDVTAKVHALPVNPGSAIAAFAVNGSQLEAYGVTNDQDVHQFTFKSGHWSDEDLTALAGQMDFGIGGMAAFRTLPDNQFHLFYSPNDLDQLFFDGTNWTDIDLTTLTGGGIPNGPGGMAGFAIKTVQHGFYVAQ